MVRSRSNQTLLHAKKTLNCSNGCEMDQLYTNFAFCIIIEIEFEKNCQNYNPRRLLKLAGVQLALS